MTAPDELIARWNARHGITDTPAPADPTAATPADPMRARNEAETAAVVRGLSGGCSCEGCRDEDATDRARRRSPDRWSPFI